MSSTAQNRWKWIAGIIIVLVILVSGIGYYLWTLFTAPLYTPGMVRNEQNLRAPLTPPEQTGNSDFWQVEEDIQLYHFSVGEGRNVLIIHGGPGIPYTEAWDALTPLNNDFQFHFYDQRGAGQSTRPFDTFESSNTWNNMQSLDQTLGIGAQLADIERIRQILGDEQLIIIGHSFGAFHAALYAAEFPGHVAGLVLVNPANVLVMPRDEDDLFDTVRDRLPEDMLDDYDDFISRYFAFNDLFSNSEADLVALNNEFAVFYQIAMGVELPVQGEPGGWMVMAQYVSMGQRHDYREALSAIEAPVLILHGENDLQSIDVANMYADALPDARVEVIPDSTHFPFDEQPELFAETVGEFLESLP